MEWVSDNYRLILTILGYLILFQIFITTRIIYKYKQSVVIFTDFIIRILIISSCIFIVIYNIQPSEQSIVDSLRIQADKQSNIVSVKLIIEGE